MVFTISPLGGQHERDSVENKPASLLVGPREKHLTGILHLYVVDGLDVGPRSRSIAIRDCPI